VTAANISIAEPVDEFAAAHSYRSGAIQDESAYRVFVFAEARLNYSVQVPQHPSSNRRGPTHRRTCGQASATACWSVATIASAQFAYELTRHCCDRRRGINENISKDFEHAIKMKVISSTTAAMTRRA
jgi:hypothetical protein